MLVSLVRDGLMYELDTAGVERFPGHEKWGKWGNEKKGKRERKRKKGWT
jgi:hypothetical protein